jgi:hypothetical protein
MWNKEFKSPWMSPIITTFCGVFNSANPAVIDPPGMILHCLSLSMILTAASIIATKFAEFAVIEDRYRLSKYITRI